jgi:putative membrane protein
MAFEIKKEELELKKLGKTILFSSIGVLIAAGTTSGIGYSNALSFLGAIIILAILNAILKPLLIFFALPFVVITLGLGIWIINAALLALTGALVDGFYVNSFGAALWGAFCISASGGVGSFILATKDMKHITINHPKRPESMKKRSYKDDNVIDI